jgi:hypothetical protein
MSPQPARETASRRRAAPTTARPFRNGADQPLRLATALKLDADENDHLMTANIHRNPCLKT